MAKLVWSSELYKGLKLKSQDILKLGDLSDLNPFQQLKLEDKTIDWIKFVADFYEVVGWRNVERRAPKIQKNYWMRTGKLDHSDYIINPQTNPYSWTIQLLTPPDSVSPLEQFYPLANNFIDVMRGEFIKRDNTWSVEAVDEHSKSLLFEERDSRFQEVIMQMAMVEKQKALAAMGLTPEVDPEQYNRQLQEAQRQLVEVEFKTSSNFKTVGVQWAEKVLEIQDRRYNLSEVEPDGFESGLITDGEAWHIDLLEDDFRVELLNMKYLDYHMSESHKYFSQGDYILWFDHFSAGDIINKFGRRMKEEDIKKLEDVFFKTANLMVVDQLKNRQGAYYDYSKSWSEATDLNPVMNDALLGKELTYNYLQSPNFTSTMDVDIFDPNYGRISTGAPQMFRVMRLYWRSMKRLGWLTRIKRDGTLVPPQWIDENYKVTEEPVYDQSVVKEKTKDNLLYGEHVDWTWCTEWRHVIKIGANEKHSFFLSGNNSWDPIYLDGGPVKFQFQGRDDHFDALPPIEGCIFNHINATGHSLIDRIKPWQIIYNICMNKVPKKFLADKGNKLAIDTRIMTNPNGGSNVDLLDQMEAYDDMLENSDVLPYKLSREAMEGLGQPALPQVIPLGTGQEAAFYLEMADRIKWMAGESIGITRQRLGGSKASETKFGIQQGITYSETQTEKYYEQHANLMQRFRQRMLDAAQYYTTFHESARDVYQNNRNENVWVDIEGMENLLPKYNITLKSTANVRSVLDGLKQFLMEENTLPIKASDKVSALAGKSVEQIVNLIKKGEIDAERMQAQQQQSEMDMRRQEIEAENLRQQQALEHESIEKDKDRQSNEYIAELKVQDSPEPTGMLDPKDQMAGSLKSQEMADKRRMQEQQLNSQREQNLDKLMVDREKAHLEIEKEKIKQKGALDVAKENKSAAEMKKRQSKK